MKIETISPLGFCPGAERAIDIFRRRAPLESLGQVLHNRMVVAELERWGITVISSLGEAKGKVIGIPSHGAPKLTYDEINARGLSLVDATCPTVVKARRAAIGASSEGYFVVIFGDPLHSEVKGIAGWVNGNKIATTSPSQVPSLKGQKVAFICQTTRDYDSYLQFIKEAMHQEQRLWQVGEIRIFNTMCPVVKERVEKSIELAKKVDLMLVVGDKASANTNRLTEACSQYTQTIQVSGVNEINNLTLSRINSIGITSGTSAPMETLRAIKNSIPEGNQKWNKELK